MTAAKAIIKLRTIISSNLLQHQLKILATKDKNYSNYCVNKLSDASNICININKGLFMPILREKKHTT